MGKVVNSNHPLIASLAAWLIMSIFNAAWEIVLCQQQVKNQAKALILAKNVDKALRWTIATTRFPPAPLVAVPNSDALVNMSAQSSHSFLDSWSECED